MSLFEGFLETDLLAAELKQPLDGIPSSGLAEIFLAIRTDSDPGSNLNNPKLTGDGTRENPFAANTASQFNFVLRSYARAKNMTIHIGPGLFRTEGGFDSQGISSNPFRLSDGMRIIGAGMFSTVLRLTSRIAVSNAERVMSVIGDVIDSTNDVEICDLTIDCNLGDQPWTPGRQYAWMSLYAVTFQALGNAPAKNCRLRRVRLINFGTRTPQRLNGAQVDATNEGFPFFLISDGCILEDCIIEQPFRGCARETTIINVGGASNVVRNNYINCAFVNPSNGLPTVIDSISSSGTTVTVTTRFPHNVCASRPYSGGAADYIEIKGATPSSYNGRWQVTSPLLEDPMSRVLTFEMASPPGAGSGGTVEQSFPPTMRVTSAVVSGTAPNLIMTVTTPSPHYRKQGDYVAITGAELVYVDSYTRLQDVFNGTYQVTGVPNANSFTFALDPDVVGLIGTTQPQGEIWLDHRPNSLFTALRFVDGEEDDFWCLWGDLDHGFEMSEGLATITMCRDEVVVSPMGLKASKWPDVRKFSAHSGLPLPTGFG